MHPVFGNYPDPIAGKRRSVCNLTDEQIAQRSTWSRVPDLDGSPLLGMHAINVGMMGRTTVTVVNPLDPGTVDDGNATDGGGTGWLEPAGTWRVPMLRAGRR